MPKEIMHFIVQNLDYNREQTYVKFTIDGVPYFGRIDNNKSNCVIITTPVANIRKYVSTSHKLLANKDGRLELEMLKVLLEGGLLDNKGISFAHGDNCKPPPQHLIKHIRNTIIDQMTSRFKKCYNKTVKHKKFNEKNPYIPLSSIN